MAKIGDAERLAHMLDYAKTAVRISQNRNRSQLDSDEVYSLAIVRALEVVGEAASRVSPECQANSTSIPWSSIVGLRHRIVHGYDILDRDLIWKIVTEDLEPLIKALEMLAQPLNNP